MAAMTPDELATIAKAKFTSFASDAGRFLKNMVGTMREPPTFPLIFPSPPSAPILGPVST